MRRERWISLVLMAAMLISATGCETMRKKFTRKPKNVKPPEPIFTLDQEYRPEFPPEIRYQAHFAYWKAAHDDLIEGLTTGTRARRERAVHNAIKELKIMQALVQGPQAEEMGRTIEELELLKQRLQDPVLDAPRLSVLRGSIEALRRHIDKRYDYRHMKANLKSETPAALSTEVPPAAGDAAPAH